MDMYIPNIPLIAYVCMLQVSNFTPSTVVIRIKLLTWFRNTF